MGKRRFNDWLEDKDFTNSIEFQDKYYFETLCQHIARFLKIIPVNTIIRWDNNTHRFYLHVGKNKKYFEVDVNVSYADFITLMKRWLFQFYPKYELVYEDEVSLSEEEILEKIKNEKINLNDALLLTKTEERKEYGIIEKIQLKNDEFIFNHNGIKYVRLATGTQDNQIVLSVFLKNVRPDRGLTDEEIKQYIFRNSVEVKRLNENVSPVPINYIGMTMFNFFVINYPDLKDEKIIRIDNNRYKWGRYMITFDSSVIEKDCLKFLKDKQKQMSITPP